MAELADALDLGSSVNRRAGSTPVIRIRKALVLQGLFNFCDIFHVASFCLKDSICYGIQFKWHCSI